MNWKKLIKYETDPSNKYVLVSETNELKVTLSIMMLATLPGHVSETNELKVALFLSPVASAFRKYQKRMNWK